VLLKFATPTDVDVQQFSRPSTKCSQRMLETDEQPLAREHSVEQTAMRRTTPLMAGHRRELKSCDLKGLHLSELPPFP